MNKTPFAVCKTCGKVWINFEDTNAVQFIRAFNDAKEVCYGWNCGVCGQPYIKKYSNTIEL